MTTIARVAALLALGAAVGAVAQALRLPAVWLTGREPTGALGGAALAGQASLATYLLTAVVAAAGVALGARLPIPAGVLLGPLLLGIAATQLGLLHPAWPLGVPEAAYV